MASIAMFVHRKSGFEANVFSTNYTQGPDPHDLIRPMFGFDLTGDLCLLQPFCDHF